MLTDLGDALDAAGVPWTGVGYSPVDPTGAADWTSRGRPASTGPFNPAGVLCHHTASPAGTTAAADLNVILCGNGSAPGPISQLYISRSAELYVVAAGRANHGGTGSRPGVDAGCTDMNAVLVGIEVGNDGVGERWPDPVCELYGRTVAALLDHYGWDLGQVFLHATTGPQCGNHKIDPAGPWTRQPDLPGGGAGTWNVATWREWCGQYVGDNPPPGAEATPSDRRRSMSDFVVIYGIPDVADGTVLELVQGTKRHVSGDEWWQVLKGVVMAPDGSVPTHHPWQPVAFVTNGYYALSLPDFDHATSLAVPTLDAADAPDAG
jgi:hypothetical protein